MAIRFANPSSSESDYNLFSIEKFNGVDYTTTPTLVDNSRAIEISNYLPKGNSLVKRNGISMVSQIYYDGKLQYIHNVWEDPYDATKLNLEKRYIVYASEKVGDKYINPRLFGCYNINKKGMMNCSVLYQFDNYNYSAPKLISEEDLYSYGVYFEGKLFLLCYDNYLLTLLPNENYSSRIGKVSNNAYTPTLIVGLGDYLSTTKSSVLEQINLLNNACNIEVLTPPEDEEYIYNLYQFFGEKDYTITNINNYSASGISNEGVYINGLGTFSFVNVDGHDKKMLKLNRTKKDDDTAERYKDIYIRLRIVCDDDLSEKIVEKMRFGVPYGSYGHRDRLFLSGNPDYPNLDIHSCETNDSANPWKDYTYFGDMSYASIGTSDSAIKGYGFLNNGYMAIVKETMNNSPNLYFRSYEISPDEEGYYKEVFPITVSGLSIDVPDINQIMPYGNDLLVNTPKGIYKIMAGESTATQIYKTVEMSYYIRENLGRNTANSCWIVFDGKLFVCREDYRGEKRIYIADENRYSFIDGNQVYEWFVLDGISVDKFYVFDNKLYFSDKKAIYCFNEKFTDEKFLLVPDANVNGQEFSKDVFVDEIDDLIIVKSNHEIFSDILNSEDVQEEWKNFKNDVKIQFNTDFYIPKNGDYVEKKDGLYYTIKSNDEIYVFYNLLSTIITNCKKQKEFELPKVKLFSHEKEYFVEDILFVDKNSYLIKLTEEIESPIKINHYPSFCLNSDKQHFKIDIDELYTIYSKINEDNQEEKVKIPFSDCIIFENSWGYFDENGNFVYIGDVDKLVFNYITLKLYNYKLDFSSLNGYISPINNVSLHFYKNITSYWHSKFNSFGRLDYLKSINFITFVADTVRYGVTDIGYRTIKKTVTMPTDFNYRFNLDFDDIDFDYFSFSANPFAQTYTSKKKIKNFAFLQFSFESNSDKDSTIVSMSCRYKYTKNNKGVK